MRRTLLAGALVIATAAPALATREDRDADAYPGITAAVEYVRSESIGRRLIEIYQADMGTRRYAHRSLWCAWYLGRALDRAGHRGTGSDMARSYLSWGRAVRSPQPGDIAILSRGRRGGHVGVVIRMDGRDPVLISANHGDTVAIATYPAHRVLGYRRAN